MQATFDFTAGVLLRGNIRRTLMGCASEGITFKEDKGFIDSYFVVKGPQSPMTTLYQTLKARFN